MSRYKRFLQLFWIALISFAVTSYMLRPDWFDADQFIDFRDSNLTLCMITYSVITLIRALFFIPSTVTLLIGIALFPEEFWFLLAINLAGIMSGSLLLYFAAIFFNSEELFNARQLKSLPKIKSKINRFGFTIVLAWSFFPFVPTDLICFVSGSTRMPLKKFVPAIFIGETALVCLYLITGQELLDLL